MRHKFIWRGISTLLSVFLVISIFITIIALDYATEINAYLGVSTSRVVDTGNQNSDTIYYKSNYGDFTPDNLRVLISDTYEQTIKEGEEGFVLLRNEHNALPLDANSERITTFGHASVDPLYHTVSAGTSLYTDNPEYMIDLKEGLTYGGFAINETLWNHYLNSSIKTIDRRTKGSGITEEDISFLNGYEDTWQGDVALVMLAREAGEGTDMFVSETDIDDQVISSLALHARERDLFNLLKNEKDAGHISKVIVIINSPYFMELDWFNDYDVDAALWICTPGTEGFKGLANILNGSVNPSGQLTDTWASDSLSSPAIVNAANNTPTWSNVDEVISAIDNEDGSDFSVKWVSVQQENIYVGYKYYETRYEDVIMRQGDANSAIGAFKSNGSWNYADEMCYPFGFGLSYTTFTQEIKHVSYDSSTGYYDVTVTVTNTGSVSGKKAVLVYAQTPYGEYEKTYLVEKSSIQLVAYDKTDLLNPNESVDIIIPVERYLLASYDYANTESYILSGGDYYFSVGNSAHEALNNILGFKGYTGLYDQNGATYTANEDSVYKITQGVPALNSAPDTFSYAYTDSTGIRVRNQFEDSDYNYWETGDTVTYLTRQDWSGTFPISAVNVRCVGEDMLKALSGDTYDVTTSSLSASDISLGLYSGLSFIDMVGVAYNDELLWESLLHQLTINELSLLLQDNGSSPAVAAITLPFANRGDGDDSLGESFPSVLGYGEQTVDNDEDLIRPFNLYTQVLAATWNKTLQENRGRLMGEECLFGRVSATFTGGGNLKRTPFSGRNQEYDSEDAFVVYLVEEIKLGALQSTGVIAGPKHFANNDWEVYRQGVSIFYTEQAMREGSLRGFESILRNDKANAHYVMQSFTRQGVTYSGQSYALNTSILREEWGFEGAVISDACIGTYQQHYIECILAGTDNFCFDRGDAGRHVTSVINTFDNGDVLNALRKAFKNTVYMYAHSNLTNGITSTTIIEKVTPVWQIGLYVTLGTISLLTVGAITMFVFYTYIKKGGIE